MANLKKHIDFVHSDGKISKKKNYKCDEFFQAQSFNQRNDTVHEGKKDHKCDSCSKSFTSMGVLRTHIWSVPAI